MRVRRSLAFLLLSLAWAGTATAQPPPPGHTRVAIASRTSTPPVIDGTLAEPLWADGAVADAFWDSEHQRAPQDQTSVRVLYDDVAVYFAITCLDAQPDRIRAIQIARGSGPGLDDHVTIELDPHHNHRSLSRFTVTARGTQSEVLAGGRAGQREWAGAWRAAARQTPSGWTAEVAIPLEMLEFDPETETFGLNISRYQHRTRQRSEWANLTAQRLPEEAGHLTGLRLARVAGSGRLAAMQYLSAGTGDPRATNAVGTGVDVRYQWLGTMTSMVSARPDFSGIDTDATPVAFSYTEQFVRDRRPFFQEGTAFFGGRELFHSGRIDRFDVGVKTFGRIDGYQVGVLATSDRTTGRSDYVGRVLKEIGPAFNVSATLVGTDRSTVNNETVQLQAGGRLGRHLRIEGQVAQSATADAGGDGGRRRGEVKYETPHWYSGGWMDDTDPDYFAANGFLAADVIGTTGRGVYGGYTSAFGDAWMRRADASVSVDIRDTSDGARQRETTSLYAGAQTAANIRIDAGFTVGSYRPRGTAPNQWLDVLNEDRYYLASASYESPTGHFGYGAQYSWGFVGVQEYASLAPNVWLAPTPHLSLAYSFERAEHDAVRHQHVLTGTWDISEAQALSARWLEDAGGYYRVSYRRTLTGSVDAYGLYTASPYDTGTLNVKFVWTLVAARP